MNNGSDDPPGYASPPCFAHELEYDPDGYVAVDRTRADDVARWRKSERRRLVYARLAMPAAERRRIASVVAERLDRLLRGVDGAVVSLYWPIRGELNLRPWMQAVHESGEHQDPGGTPHGWRRLGRWPRAVKLLTSSSCAWSCAASTR